MWPLARQEPPLNPVLLDGFRIFMRPPRLTDFLEWQRVRHKNYNYLKPFEPAWNKYALTLQYFARRVARQEIAWKKGNACAFLIFRKDTGDLIGGLNINDISRGAAQHGSLGYWIDEDHQGQGYMAEALRLTLEFSFTKLKLQRVNAFCIPPNTRSKNLLLRGGFKEEGFAERYVEIDGRWQDHFLFGMTLERWRELGAARAVG
jgi:ribosomal-protein-alanine N-acetyltransferase